MLSITKQTINNEVVLFRNLIKKVKVHVIHKLTKKAQSLRTKKGTEEQILKNQKKADKFGEEVCRLKKLHPDFLAKNILFLTESPSKNEDSALERIKNHKLTLERIEKLKTKYEGVIFSNFIKINKTNKKKKNKLENNFNDKTLNLEKQENIDKIKNVKNKKRKINIEENHSKSIKKSQNKRITNNLLPKKRLEQNDFENNVDYKDINFEKDCEGTNDSEKDDCTEENNSEEENNSIEKNESSENEKLEENKSIEKIQSDEECNVKKYDSKQKISKIQIKNVKIKNNTAVIKPFFEYLKENETQDVNDIKNDNDFFKKSKIDAKNTKEKISVDPFFTTIKGDAKYVQIEEEKRQIQSKQNVYHDGMNRKQRRNPNIGRNKKMIKNKTFDKFNKSSISNFSGSKKFEKKTNFNKQSFDKTFDNVNNKTFVKKRENFVEINNKVEDNLHPSWQAKKKLKPQITEFKGKKITFDD